MTAAPDSRMAETMQTITTMREQLKKDPEMARVDAVDKLVSLGFTTQQAWATVWRNSK